MTSFIHLDYSTEHPGVTRLSSAAAFALVAAQRAKFYLFSARALAALLLSAVAAAAMVVAYQVMDTMAEGHLLVLWIGLWTAAFASLMVCASTANAVAINLKSALDRWSRNVATKRADERLWAMAKTDTRVMADLQCALSRGRVLEDPRDAGLSFVAPLHTGTGAKPLGAAKTPAPLLKPPQPNAAPAYHRLYI